MRPETPPIAGFDALEADCLDLIVDTFSQRDESGEPAKATFSRDPLAPFESEYILTQPPAVVAVDFDGDDLSRAEQATIECKRELFPVSVTSLPEDCKVILPDSGQWSIDKMRGTKFGPNWVTVYLSRKPQLKQTARRMG